MQLAFLLLYKDGLGSIGQAGSQLLARLFACKMSECSLFRDDSFKVEEKSDIEAYLKACLKPKI